MLTKPELPTPPRTRPEQAEPRRGQRLLFLSVLFGVMLSFPLLGVFDQDKRVGGVPVLYLYVLLMWFLLVGLTAYLVRKRREE
ncbi:hypothetical protein AUC43_14765 [Hymenobacter sedentarius]|uniref:DUF3311 domain-containing protein n=1 Tax=Hymenobacter sedentarius TaxID=1411621 RepID=A0A0U4AZP0_9BACT|nr:hypothetical protein [Hymenobacter sedentarius]ALW86237.1 hypothetical protein AUC43_14765 [Hymenobacter sedentarius]